MLLNQGFDNQSNFLLRAVHLVQRYRESQAIAQFRFSDHDLYFAPMLSGIKQN